MRVGERLTEFPQIWRWEHTGRFSALIQLTSTQGSTQTLVSSEFDLINLVLSYPNPSLFSTMCVWGGGQSVIQLLTIILRVLCQCPLGTITIICSLSPMPFMGADGWTLDLKSQPVPLIFVCKS